MWVTTSVELYPCIRCMVSSTMSSWQGCREPPHMSPMAKAVTLNLGPRGKHGGGSSRKSRLGRPYGRAGGASPRSAWVNPLRCERSHSRSSHAMKMSWLERETRRVGKRKGTVAMSGRKGTIVKRRPPVTGLARFVQTSAPLEMMIHPLQPARGGVLARCEFVQVLV